MKKLTKKIALFAVAAAAGFALISCGSSSAPPPKPESASTTAPAPPAAPAIPPDIQKAAETALGSEAEVLVFGDLAKTGRQQILAVNRLKSTPPGIAPGTLVTRAVILENDGDAWKQILLCDEHLKNTKGYLGGTPLAPVNGWRLQYEQDDKKGLQLYFTPLVPPKGAHLMPVGVRWNPPAKRYQSLDRTFENFLGELQTLETPESQIRQ
jgi:hypothetical protein